MKQLTLALISIATLMQFSASAKAEPPPYGPSPTDWGDCYDADTNGTGGLVTVICPTLTAGAGNTAPQAAVAASAKASCETMFEGSFVTIEQKSYCVYKATRSGTRWVDIRRGVADQRSVAAVRTGPLRPSPTNPPPPFAQLSNGNIGPNNPPSLYFCNYNGVPSCFSGFSECKDANGGRPCFMFNEEAIRATPLPTGTRAQILNVLAATPLQPDYIPKARHWVSPAETCKSQDGTKEGYVSDGDGGRRCEYWLARPMSRPAVSQR